MFSGIIEATGEVIRIDDNNSNKDFYIKANFDEDLYIDQSIAHNGVCLTIVGIEGDTYRVTAILESLDRSNMGDLTVGSYVNLERAVKGSTRMDGHIVQGHVDTVCKCKSVEDVNGSWVFTFSLDASQSHLLVDKGSVCLNGVSLTVNNPTDDTFQVAIIPYTYEYTNFKNLKSGDRVNIEFDIIGKYVSRYMERITQKQ